MAHLLAVNHMTDYFAGCLARDDGYPRRSALTAFEAVLKAHGLKREETIAVVDRDIDIETGQSAGASTCFCGPEPGAVDADLEICDLRELLRFLVSENS